MPHAASPTPSTPLARGPARVLAVASLGVSGLLLALGGALHPVVPATTAAQMEHLASERAWSPVHWVVTLAQLLAIPGVVAFATLARGDRGGGLLPAGAAVVALGFAIGALGTLASATALKTAATVADVGLFETVNAFTLGLGWLCVVVAAFGGALVGLHLVRWPLASSRALGTVVLGGSLAFLVSAAVLPPSHPWTHPGLLRYGAVLTGLLLAVIAAFLARADGRRSEARQESTAREA